jgi:hypothetical protein
METGNWKLEIGNWKIENGKWKLAIGKDCEHFSGCKADQGL